MNQIEQIEKLQKDASNPENSAWVFASAGSGKTKVLVDRVLRLLLNKISARKILCITFTKAAAIEMKERIIKDLSNWVILDNEKLKLELQKLGFNFVNEDFLRYARSLFAKIMEQDFEIKIQTIHAFCQNLVKIFPLEIGISPNFEIMDDILEEVLLQRAKKEVFDMAKFDNNLQNIIFQISSRQSEEGFLSLISEILNKKEQLTFLKIRFFNIENLISEIAKKFDLENISNKNQIIKEFKREINFKKLQEIALILQNSRKKTDIKTAQNLFELVKNQEELPINVLQNIFLKQDGNFKSKTSICTKEFEEFYDFFEEFQCKLDIFLDKVNSFEIYQFSSYLLKLTDLILHKYDEIKRKNSVLDYNDLIIKANQLLENTEYKEWVKFKMDSFYDHILIDESQDTNYKQWQIVKYLTEEFFSGQGVSENPRSLFIIGDDKQSIYGFQGAMPNISREIYEYYKQRTDSQNIKKVELQNSFRSLPKVLQFVDEIFLGQGDNKIENYQEHSAFRKGEGLIEIWPRIEPEKKEKSNDLTWKNEIIKDKILDEEFCQKQEMAKQICDKIINLVKNENYSYGDFMILLRTRAGGFDRILQEKFLENKIPFRGSRKIKFSENLLIQDLISVLNFVLLTKDDLNLACLLKSPIFNIGEQKLYELCKLKNNKDITLFQALKLGNEDEILQKLEKYIEYSKKNDIYEFYNLVIDVSLRENFSKYFSHISDEIIDKFLLEILSFVKNGFANLQKFLEYVIKSDPKILIEEAEKNSVFISTIHSSKGLQSKIVILPDCCFSFNKMNSGKQNIYWLNHKSENYGEVSLPIWGLNKKNQNNLLKIHKKERLRQLKDEYWRLFYVALTRAEDRIYLSGFGADNDIDSWYNVALKAFEKIKDK